MKFAVIASIASVLVGFAAADNDLYWYNLPTKKQGGAFVAGSTETVVFCFEKKPDSKLADAKFKLDGPRFNNQRFKGLHATPLNSAKLEELKGHVIQRWSFATGLQVSEVEQLFNKATQPAEVQMESLPVDPAPAQPGPSLMKRGIFRDDKDGGSVFDIKEEFLAGMGQDDYQRCQYIDLPLKANLKTSAKYELKMQRRRWHYMTHKEWESPEFTIIRPPQQVREYITKQQKALKNQEKLAPLGADDTAPLIDQQTKPGMREQANNLWSRWFGKKEEAPLDGAPDIPPQ